jgi:hypothetical protein
MSFAYQCELKKTTAEDVLVQGVISVEGEEILFEYKLYDQHGVSTSTLNKYSITVDVLKSVRYQKSLFTAYLIIETTNPVFLQPLPGSEQGKLPLIIPRIDRKQAQEFSIKMTDALQERRNRNPDIS